MAKPTKKVVPLLPDQRKASENVDDVVEWINEEIRGGTVRGIAVALVHEDHSVSWHRGILQSGALIGALESLKQAVLRDWDED